MAEIILKNVRIGFPTLWEAEEYKGDGKFNYSVKAFIEPDSENDKKIRETIKQEAMAKWPKKYEMLLEEMRLDKKAYCYVDGKRVEYDHPEGNWILTAKRRETDGRPLIIDQRKNPLTEKDGKPYSGCYCNIKVEIYAQDGDNKGIRCGFATIQFAKDGESFGGTKPATDDGFDDLGDTGDGDDLC